MDVSWVVGQWSQLGVVAGKAALMYVTALVGERRTLPQWTIIDFVNHGGDRGPDGDLTVVPEASGPVPPARPAGMTTWQESCQVSDTESGRVTSSAGTYSSSRQYYYGGGV